MFGLGHNLFQMSSRIEADWGAHEIKRCIRLSVPLPYSNLQDTTAGTGCVRIIMPLWDMPSAHLVLS